MQVSALDLDLTLVDRSAITKLTDTDWALLKSTAKQALNNSEDGSSHVWKNAETSNAGVVTILSTVDNCRNTRFINTAGELTSTTIVNLCKQQDKWVEVSARSTSSEPSAYDTFGETPSTSSEITAKPISQTSDHCRELSQNIAALKGKPLRRSAAIELHKAECMR